MNNVKCRVYKGRKKEGSYLYVADDTATDDLPAALLSALGELSLVMDLELSAERKLAREDVNVVMENLRGQGFHLQMPPREIERLDD
ncbi:MAG: YcgL domain-containing protein [Chromatiales bacterium]|nr:YcgL domain-containing protein [Chromatiales bacterium]